MELTGLILAGGENSRFDGLPKGSLKWDGRSLFDRVHQSLTSAVDGEVYVSVHGDRPAGLPDDVSTIADRWSDVRGPMNGICSSLIELDAALLVLTWDMPGINAMFLREFVKAWCDDTADAYYVSQGDQPQPFPGIYTPDCVESLRSSIEAERWGMIQWLRENEAETFEISQESGTTDPQSLLMNVNSPEDIRDLDQLSE